MRAVTFVDVERIECAEAGEPRILDDGDVVVEVDVAGICGSDLHPYFGRERGLDPGTVMGHEFVGRIVDTGRDVRAFAVGDRVVAPFTTCCGSCAYCAIGLTSRCVRGQLFGWVSGGVGLQGAQAEFVRVPLADTTLVAVPAAVDDDGVALLAGDVLGTALFGVELAGLVPGDAAAVVGCGPVGALAVLAALERGARVVFALDRVSSRLELASTFGAVAVRANEPAEAVERVKSETNGIGVDRVIEAVGSPDATRLAADLLRPGGSIAAVGVHVEPHLALSPGELYDRNVTYAAGRSPARRLLPHALELASRNAPLLAQLITHRLPLEDGVEAYRRLAAREEGMGKVLLYPVNGRRDPVN